MIHLCHELDVNFWAFILIVYRRRSHLERYSKSAGVLWVLIYVSTFTICVI